MNASFRLFFQVASIARVLGIALIFLLEWLWDLNMPDTGSWPDFKIDIKFSTWEYLLMYSLVISFLANTIISLLISFWPHWSLSAFLKHKAIPLFFYIVELLVLPFLIYLSYEKIQDAFFPSSNYISEVLKYIIPGNSAVSVHEKYEAINTVLLAACSLVFVVCFWKFYTARIKEYELSEQPA
jgi:hypothetical protein